MTGFFHIFERQPAFRGRKFFRKNRGSKEAPKPDTSDAKSEEFTAEVHFRCQNDPPRFSVDSGRSFKQFNSSNPRNSPVDDYNEAGWPSVPVEPPRMSLDSRQGSKVSLYFSGRPQDNKECSKIIPVYMEPPRMSLDSRVLFQPSSEIDHKLRTFLLEEQLKECSEGKGIESFHGLTRAPEVDWKDAPRRSFEVKKSGKPLQKPKGCKQDLQVSNDDFADSLQMLAMLRRASNGTHNKIPPRFSVDLQGLPKEAPRHSCDGWETAKPWNNNSFRAPWNGRDPARLSVDGIFQLREKLSAKLHENDTSFDVPRRSFDIKNTNKSSVNSTVPRFERSSSEKVPDNGSKRKVPNVIARLMGLEDMPQETSIPHPKQVSAEGKTLQGLFHYNPPEVVDKREITLLSSSLNGTRVSNRDVKSTGDQLLVSSRKIKSSKSLEREITQRETRLDMLHSSDSEPGSWMNARQSFQRQREAKNLQNALEIVIPKGNGSKKDVSNPFPPNQTDKLKDVHLQDNDDERKTLKQILQSMQLKGLLHLQDEELNVLDENRDMTERNLRQSEKENLNNKAEGILPKAEETDDTQEIHDVHIDQPNEMVQHNISTQIQPAEASIVLIKPVSNSESIPKFLKDVSASKTKIHRRDDQKNKIRNSARVVKPWQIIPKKEEKIGERKAVDMTVVIAEVPLGKDNTACKESILVQNPMCQEGPVWIKQQNSLSTVTAATNTYRPSQSKLKTNVVSVTKDRLESRKKLIESSRSGSLERKKMVSSRLESPAKVQLRKKSPVDSKNRKQDSVNIQIKGTQEQKHGKHLMTKNVTAKSLQNNMNTRSMKSTMVGEETASLVGQCDSRNTCMLRAEIDIKRSCDILTKKGGVPSASCSTDGDSKDNLSPISVLDAAFDEENSITKRVIDFNIGWKDNESYSQDCLTKLQRCDDFDDPKDQLKPVKKTEEEHRTRTGLTTAIYASFGADSLGSAAVTQKNIDAAKEVLLNVCSDESASLFANRFQDVEQGHQKRVKQENNRRTEEAVGKNMKRAKQCIQADCLNEILQRKLLPLRNGCPWISHPDTPLYKIPSISLLVREAKVEMQQLPCLATGEECEMLYTVLEDDIKQSSHEWSYSTTEVVDMGCSLENVIFEEVLEDEINGLIQLSVRWARKDEDRHRMISPILGSM